MRQLEDGGRPIDLVANLRSRTVHQPADLQRMRFLGAPFRNARPGLRHTGIRLARVAEEMMKPEVIVGIAAARPVFDRLSAPRRGEVMARRRAQKPRRYDARRIKRREGKKTL